MYIPYAPFRAFRYVLILSGLLLLSRIPAYSEEFDGFITAIDSATSFDVGELHIVMSVQAVCEDWTPYFGLNYLPPNGKSAQPISYPVSPLSAKPLRTQRVGCSSQKRSIGSRIHIAGHNVPESGAFLASDVDVFHSRRFTQLSGVAVLDDIPDISHGPEGWTGSIQIDGFPVTVTQKTVIVCLPDSTKLVYRIGGGSLTYSVTTKTNGASSPCTANLIRPGMSVQYKAERADDGALIATTLRFWPNNVDPLELQYLARYHATFEHQPSNGNYPSTIRFSGAAPIRVVQDPSIETMIAAIGDQFIPSYQKALGDTDPNKIVFRFYVVHPFTVTSADYFTSVDAMMPTFSRAGALKHLHDFTFKGPRVNSMVTSVVTTPSGIVLIPDVVLAHLSNQAQLAALISYAVTSIVQRQGWLAWSWITSPEARKALYRMDANPYANVPESISQVSYWQSEQQLRIGIRSLFHLGYDIREIPFTWGIAQGHMIHNPVEGGDRLEPGISSTPWYVSYTMNYLSHYYPDANTRKLTKGDEQYVQLLDRLRREDPQAFEVNSPTN